MDDFAVVIAAGGASRRFGTGNKLLCDVQGKPLFLHCLGPFLRMAAPGCLVIVYPRGEETLFRNAAKPFLPETAGVVWVAGGACRSASVRAGLDAIPLKRGIVAVHDAARPLASKELLAKLIEEARRTGGAIPGKPVIDTLKRSGESGLVIETVDRSDMWQVETPQVFDLARLRAAYARFPDEDFSDDAGAMAAAGGACRIVNNPELNFKVTYPEDLERLRRIFAGKVS